MRRKNTEIPVDMKRLQKRLMEGIESELGRVLNEEITEEYTDGEICDMLDDARESLIDSNSFPIPPIFNEYQFSYIDAREVRNGLRDSAESIEDVVKDVLLDVYLKIYRQSREL